MGDVFKIISVVLFFAAIILLQALPSQNITTQALQEHFVRPADGGQDCSREQPCLTLETYLQDVEYFFSSNTVFHFLPGIHIVSWPNATSAIINNVSDLILKGLPSESGNPFVSIHCNWNLEFCFQNVRRLAIRNIEFKQCGFSSSKSECPLIIKGFLTALRRIIPHLTIPAALKIADSHTVTLSNVSVWNSHNYGMIGILGLFVVSGCTFSKNSWGQVNKTYTQDTWPHEKYIPWKRQEVTSYYFMMTLSHQLTSGMALS